jgi:hypothetical protein
MIFTLKISIFVSIPRSALIRNMHAAFFVPYVYDYITKLCRQYAKFIQNHENDNVPNIGQGEAQHGIQVQLGGGQVYMTVQVSKWPCSVTIWHKFAVPSMD